MNYKEMKQTLIDKKYTFNGLVAWGQSTGSMWGDAIGVSLGGMIGAAIRTSTKKQYAFTCAKNKLLIIPFTHKELLLNETMAIDKSKIKTAKLTLAKFKFVTVDDKKWAYSITQGLSDLKQILKELGF